MLTRLPYGKTHLTLSLPEWPNMTLIEPVYVAGMDDPRTGLLQALQAPLGCRPLREMARSSDRIGIIFNDITRATPNELLVRAVLSQLPHVPPAQITLFNALGTHRTNTPAELCSMLGEELLASYRVVQNQPFDPSTQIFVGTTQRGHPVWLNRELWECDLVVLTGFIEPHFFAGFSGGGKAVMPGMAGIETIYANHNAAMLANPRATWGITQGNPVWEEAREVASMLKKTFLLNVTLNKDHQLTGVFCGDLDEAHRQGSEFARRVATTAVAAPFDVVLTSNSGFPLDMNLYQTVKGMSAAAQIVRPGGAIVIAAECSDGLPDHGLYAHLLREHATPQAVLDSILGSPGSVRHDQWQAQIQAQIQLKAEVYVHSDGLSDEQISAALLLPCHDIETTLASLLRHYGPAASLGVMPEGPQTIPYLMN